MPKRFKFPRDYNRGVMGMEGMVIEGIGIRKGVKKE
jgi:hypothetical protein